MSTTDHKVFICGCVRNCETHLDDAFQTIQLLQSLFAETHIIMAYDDSGDNTLSKLTKYKDTFGDKMTILLNSNPLSSIRTENIANARNSLIRKMRELNNGDSDDFEYFIMMDMDNACDHALDLDVIRRTFQKNGKWDAISFNRPGYYDAWALSISPYIYSCWGWHDPGPVIQNMREYVTDKLNGLAKDELLECRSAFNGFAIYKTDPFLQCTYSWRMPKQYMSSAELQENYQSLNFMGTHSDLNSQTDEPDCEHRSFHMEAVAEYGAKIRISPEMAFPYAVGGHI